MSSSPSGPAPAIPCPNSADVGVVILSYGPQDSAGAVISTLTADGLIGPEQVTEIHNPASPGERARGGAGQRVLNLPENVGYAGGMNAGIAAVAQRHRYVLLLTHDVRISGASVIALRDALEQDAELAVVGPVLTADGEVWSAGKQRQPDWGFPHVSQHSADSPVSRVDSLDGSVLLLRAATLGEIEFDPRFFMYFEETDFIERLRRSGAGHAAVVSGARAESIPGGPAERPISHAYLMARNGSWVAFRHGGVIGAARFALTELRETVRLIARLTPHDDGAWNSRRFAARRLAAKCRGLADSMRRRFGPPPQTLRDGDLSA